MIKPELYHKTVGILYDAYFNDTLEHANCFACAVGNIVAANMGKKFCVDSARWSDTDQKLFWHGYTPYSTVGGLNPSWFPLNSRKKMDIEILSTGYEIKDLYKIENAFEGAFSYDEDVEINMFNGLVAVLEVLKDIHRVTDEDLLQSNSKRFKDHYNKRVGATV